MQRKTTKSYLAKSKLWLAVMLALMSLTSCGKRYIISCPLVSQLKPEWEYTETVLEDNSVVFRQMAEDHNFLCMKKDNILQLSEEVLRCNSARKNMLTLIHAADIEKRPKK